MQYSQRTLVFILLLLLLTAGSPIPGTDANWIVLQDNPIQVEWIQGAANPWCKACTELPYSISRIESILEDLGNYACVFDRVSISEVLSDNVVYIRLDMPFPFAERDYIARYTRLESDDTLVYRYEAVVSSLAPDCETCVRLINAGGEWRLIPLSNGGTEITYIWNGELLGRFPEWAMTRAWIEQGTEVLVWLDEALQP